MLNYNHLYYFHIAAIEGSVAAAAQRLGVTQPTVSEQLRALERSLRAEFFERTPTGLKLTDAGRVAFEHTSVMFRLGERLVEALGQQPSRSTPTLRIGISSGIARTTTNDFLLPLMSLEDCALAIRTADAVDVLRELRAGQLDLVLCESEPSEVTRSGLDVTLIDRANLVAVAPPDVQPAADWKDIKLIQYRSPLAYRWDVEAFLEEHKLEPRVVVEADDAQFLVEASARSGCVAIVPRPLARAAIETGRLHVIAEVDSARGGLFAAYASNQLTQLVRQAVDALIKAARQGD
jgi:DNA-binding transcriptional LysR family regulator